MKLRDYQIECVDNINSLLAQNVKSMIAVLPTAAGKTCIFGKVIKDFLEREDGYCVVVSHLSILTNQTSQRFKKDWGFDSEVLQAERIPSGKHRCVIATMQSLKKENKIAQWGRNTGRFDSRVKVKMIIIDEAHYVGSKTYDEIFQLFPDAQIVGFTATPFRSNKVMTNLFERVAYTISSGELIDRGYLVPPVLKMMKINRHDDIEVYSAIKQIIKEKHATDKCVVYLKTIEQANELSKILNNDGIKTKAITSKFTGTLRDNVLDEYRVNDNIQVLTTVDVLTAGFDSPNLKVIFMPYKVSSVTSYLQRVGRGLRLHEGKKECIVYCGATSPKLDKGYWEKINNDFLKQGRKSYDNYLDDLEYLKNELTKDELEWTMEVVNLAKAVDKKGMNNISELIINKKFPDDLLKEFVDLPPIVYDKRLLKEPMTDKQVAFLKSRGYDCDKISRGEAMGLISKIIKKEGKYDERDIVPSGKFKGYFFNEVPRMYWASLTGKFGGKRYYNNTRLIELYNDFKKRHGR